MDIKIYEEGGKWIAHSKDPDLISSGKSILEALQNFTLLYEIETDYDLQRQIFGY